MKYRTETQEIIFSKGNYVGMSEADLDLLDPEDLEAKVSKARKALYGCGCHFVIDTIVELPGSFSSIYI